MHSPSVEGGHMAKQKIIRTGNSLAVIVPADFVKAIGIKPGQDVVVELHPETGQVVYTFSGTKQLALSQNFVKRRVKRRKKLSGREKSS